MKFSWFIALRYLRPKGTFVSVITLISVAGVALGVAVLLVVIAVMSGFEKTMKEELIKSESAMIVQAPELDPFLAMPVPQESDPEFPGSSGDPGETSTAPPPGSAENVGTTEAVPSPAASAAAAAELDWRGVAAVVRQHPEVKSVSPYVNVTSVLERKPTPEEEQALEKGGAPLPEVQAMLIGVDPTDAGQMERLQKLMDEKGEGSMELAGDSVILSDALGQKLNRDGRLALGISAVNVFGPAFLRQYRTYYQEQQRARDDPEKKQAVEEKDRDLPLPEELLVQGVLFDDHLGQQAAGLISLKSAQKLAGSGKGIDGLRVELTNPFRAGEVKEELIRKGVPESWMIQTWMERNQRLFDAVANERGMMYLVLACISIVAAFCIMNTMITIAVQKRREIGMMRALGAKTSQIVGLFVTKGVIVAAAGVSLGYVLGSLVLYFRNDIRDFISTAFHWQIFDERVYGLRDIPSNPRVFDNVLICSLAFILCALAAVLPAWIVGRLDPARALRTDR